MKNKNKKNFFVIAEVGQNHQGKVNLALEYVKIFAGLGADAVKFQIRNNKTLFSEEAYKAKYNSENAFAKTYGKHREKLELSYKDLIKVKKECKKHKVKFMVTPFDEESLEKICKIGVDIIKIASFDLGNLPLIHRIASKKKTTVISVGGGNMKQITSSIKTLKKNVKNIIILHCNSEYPTPYQRLGLGNIVTLKKKFKKCTIGSSDHFNGILSGPIAYMLGARVFEKHVTLNRSWRGTDHSFALEPEGFRKFVRDIERTPEMLPLKNKILIGKEAVFKKLGKSITTNKIVKKNKKIKITDLTGMIFQDNFIPVRMSNEIIGKKALKDLLPGKPIIKGDYK
jgi:N-acetylneuraminate synthase/sialic acid synthase